MSAVHSNFGSEPVSLLQLLKSYPAQFSSAEKAQEFFKQCMLAFTEDPSLTPFRDEITIRIPSCKTVDFLKVPFWSEIFCKSIPSLSITINL